MLASGTGNQCTILVRAVNRTFAALDYGKPAKIWIIVVIRRVDFAHIGVSVFCGFMSRRLRKTLAVVGLLFVVTLSGVALSLAHDTLAPQRDIYLGGVNFSPVLAHPSGGTLRTGLDCETCDAPALGLGVVQTHRPLSLPRSTREDNLIYANPYASKISLHLLDSVLLI